MILCEACGTHYQQGPCYVHSPCCSWRPLWCSWYTPEGDHVVLTAIKVYVDVLSLCCCLNSCWCLWLLFMLHLKAFWMSTVCAPFQHEIMLMTYYHLTPSWCLCCVQVQCWSLLSVLPLETMLMSVVSADARGHVNVHGPCCYQEPCGP